MKKTELLALSESFLLKVCGYGGPGHGPALPPEDKATDEAYQTQYLFGEW